MTDHEKYANKVFKMLVELEAGKTVTFAEKVRTENLPDFIQIVEQFIEVDYGRFYSPYFWVDMNSDKTKLRKVRG
jgi:hypothetical protein